MDVEGGRGLKEGGELVGEGGGRQMVLMMKKKKMGEGREKRGERREYNIINCGAHISKIIKVESLRTLL